MRTLGAKGKSKFIRVKVKDILDKFGENIEIDIANYYLPIFTNKATVIEPPQLDKTKKELEIKKREEDSVEFKIIK